MMNNQVRVANDVHPDRIYMRVKFSKELLETANIDVGDKIEVKFCENTNALRMRVDNEGEHLTTITKGGCINIRPEQLPHKLAKGYSELLPFEIVGNDWLEVKVGKDAFRLEKGFSLLNKVRQFCLVATN